MAESAVSFECNLAHWHDLTGANGKTSNTVILGEITRIHVVRSPMSCHSDKQKEGVLNPENPLLVAPEKLRPISRLGGIT